MKKLKFLFLFLLSISIFSCSSDSSDGGINLTISAVNPNVSRSAINQKTMMAEVIFTDFRISIRDVVFKNDDDATSSLDTDEVRFRGPYQIDLLDNGNALSQTIDNSCRFFILLHLEPPSANL